MVSRGMDTVVTLAERHRQKREAMHAALAAADDALATEARRLGGRFIRYGSTARGDHRVDSDVDLLADFPDDRVAVAACGIADHVCFDLGLRPDCRPTCWASAKLLARALSEGIVLR